MCNVYCVACKTDWVYLTVEYIVLLFKIRRHNGLTYATCSSNKVTCPDQICDSLEELSRWSICPQDCVDKNDVHMAFLHMDTEDSSWKTGFGTVKFPDRVCSCRGSSCSCLHKDEAHSILEEEKEATDVDEPYSSTYITTNDGNSYFAYLILLQLCTTWINTCTFAVPEDEDGLSCNSQCLAGALSASVFVSLLVIMFLVFRKRFV